ncbi:MAG: LytTR family transcriptional regulator [Sphingobacteriaceae bacterium]|nr:MAG: LytTR family transcriptional regulator [Sphingobacteriaceae bacterium]
MDVYKIMLSQQQVITFVDPDEIVYCQSDNCYTNVHLLNERIMIVKSLTKFSKELSETQFIRVSQSYLINTKFVRNINKKDKLIELSNRKCIPYTISLKELLQLMSSRAKEC